MMRLALRLAAFYVYAGGLRLLAFGRRVQRTVRFWVWASLLALVDAEFGREYCDSIVLRLRLVWGYVLLWLARCELQLWRVAIACVRRERGFGVPELLISMLIALLLATFAFSLAVTAGQQFRLHHGVLDVEESGRFALDSMARAVRQAGYRGELPFAPAPVAVHGWDKARAGGIAETLGAPLEGVLADGDVLALRFSGVGKGSSGDGSMTNCAGFGEPARPDGAWSVFYVARAPDGETELRCQYRGAHGWGADALVRGVDAFQVLYGVDLDEPADGQPNVFLRAEALSPAQWQRVVSVKLALLLHAVDSLQEMREPQRYLLFGPEGAEAAFDESQLPADLRLRPRRQFSLTVTLRNALMQEAI